MGGDTMTLDLKGKTALVTGASGQLGRTMAQSLAACGANVAVHYVKNKKIAGDLVEKIKKMGCNALAVQADITKEVSVTQMHDIVVEKLGNVDIVINNAVIQYQWTSILEQDLADFASQFESCTMQSVLTAKAFLPHMIEKKSGRFIGINTECSGLYNVNTGAYASAKRGMDGLYRVLAKEVGPSGITVNQVSPGWTISDRDRENGTEISPEYSAKIPLARRGTDQEVANVVLFLASDIASYVTGVNIPVCGGAVMV